MSRLRLPLYLKILLWFGVNLLVLAFLAEAITEIEDEAIAEDIRVRLESWLARHDN